MFKSGIKIIRSGLLVVFILANSLLYSQTGLRNDGAVIKISSGAIVELSGTGADFTNSTVEGNHGIIDMDGQLKLTGDWYNNASGSTVFYNLNASGEVIFMGSVGQSIGGGNTTDFENLTISNSAGISLGSHVYIDRELLTTGSDISLGSSKLILGYNSTLTGFNAVDGMILPESGSVIKQINTTGIYSFPLGEESGTKEFSPVYVKLTDHDGLSNAWISATVANAKAPQNSSPTDYLNRYWDLDADGITNPSFNITAYYQDADVVGTESNIYVFQYESANRIRHNKVQFSSNEIGVDGLNALGRFTGEDGTSPGVALSGGPASPTNQSTFQLTATFSEEVENFILSDISVSNGTASNLNSTGNPVFTVDITPDSDGDVYVDIPSGVAQDLAGNDNNAANQYSIVYDGTSPEPSITSESTSPTNLSPFEISIDFGEEVENFIVDDITVTNGVASNLQTTGNIIYTADITPSSDGAVDMEILAGVADDLAGNTNVASNIFSINYYENAPDATITSDELNPTNADLLTYTITFSEHMNGFEMADLDILNGTADDLSTTDEIVYELTVTPVGDGLISVTVPGGVADSDLGVPNVASNTFELNYDGTPPTAMLTTSENLLTNKPVLEVGIAFSEEVVDFLLSDLSIVNGSASNISTTDNINFDFEVSPNSDGDVEITLPASMAEDDAGNGNIASNTIVFTYDGTAPEVTITSNSSDTIETDVFEVTFEFSEAVEGFEVADVSITNGSIDGVFEVTDNKFFVADVNIASEGLVAIDVPAGAAEDNVGNLSLASSTFEIVYEIATAIDEQIPASVKFYAADGELIIRIENDRNGSFDKGQIEVYDIIGSPVANLKMDGRLEYRIPVDMYQKVYIVKVNGKRSTITKKIIPIMP